MTIDKSADLAGGDKEVAFQNAASALNLDEVLPMRVFAGTWDNFYFFQSDELFVAEFADVQRELLALEGASVACLINLDETSILEAESAAVIYFDLASSGDDFVAALGGVGGKPGWMHLVDRYVMASNRGTWCIYCEKANDVAIIALADAESARRFASPLRRLRAENIQSLVAGGSVGVTPFNRLVPTWREGLLANFSGRQPEDDSRLGEAGAHIGTTCSCGESSAEIRVDGTVKQLYPNFEMIKASDWRALLKCPVCGQLWSVDEWDKYQVQLAVKLPDANTWKLDDTDRRKAFLLRSRGGYDAGTCFRAGCEAKSIKGSAYCVDHSYAVGMRI